jgi:Uma2 family endonuclease
MLRYSQAEWGFENMSAVEKQTWTVEQYLEMERASEEKYEYLDGEIYLMSGASRNHNLIMASTLASLYSQLRKRPCFVYPSDMRVKASDSGLYAYPDISVVCGEPLLEDDPQDTLVNPIVIVEVLSPSTESYDRGKKFQHYRALQTLQEYILISQDSHRIERFLRQPNDEWLLTDAAGLDAMIELPSIQCTLALADVYEKVNFEQES